jgi:hypothetical protein
MFYDIYLYTLCYYICCLFGACMRCTWFCSLKPGVTAVEAGVVEVAGMAVVVDGAIGVTGAGRVGGGVEAVV